MDHKSAYAHHIAQAIRHKKAMSTGGEVELEEPLELGADDSFEDDALEPEMPVDAKAARKERLKQILSR